MGKQGGGGSSKKGSSKGGGGGAEAASSWSHSDHVLRKAKAQRKNKHVSSLQVEKQMRRDHRSALLTRDSKEKKEAGKLRLHIKRIEGQIQHLRGRLEQWDDVEEARLKKEAEMKRRRDEEEKGIKKKKGRKGPETWKLKGAARPAWQVYDFDTRYIDPYIQAHEEAKIKTKRSRNIFALYRGDFGWNNDDDNEERDDKQADVVPPPPQPECRDFLILLMQLGNLSMQARQKKNARKAFLECIELDSISSPITPARCQLMRLYVDENRPESARKLWERLSPDDPSVWIRYSAALIEYVSWKVLEEEGSTQQTAEELLISAIKTNVFCAYYMAFFDHFDNVIDYVDEIEDATEETPLEEAIEYCNSEQMGAWKGTEGSLKWVKSVILRVLHDDDDDVSSSTSNGVSAGTLTKEHIDWRGPIADIKEACEALAQQKVERQQGDDGTNNDTIQSDDPEEGGTASADDSDNAMEPDTAMFAGMFETAMEMLELEKNPNASGKE